MNVAVLRNENSGWVYAHEALSRLAQDRAIADAEEGRCLLAARRSAAHVHMGFGSFGEYIERLFGYGRRCTQEKLRVAEALEGLPVLARALDEGALSWSAVRELTRVAVSETEGEWLEVAYGKSVRQLEELVAGKRAGDTPGSPSKPEARRHVLRFDVAAETFAMFRGALGELRRRSGSSMDDDATLLEMARQVLGGPAEDGRSSYQIALTVCVECGAGSQEASGELVRVGAEVVSMASCDAQHLGRIDMQPANDAGKLAGGSATRIERTTQATHFVARASVRGALPKRAHVCASAEGEEDGRQQNAPAKPCGPVLTGAHSGMRANAGAARAKQDVSPAVRRSVLRRDQQCCRVPGCRNATFLDLHHIDLRSEGGDHHPDNLLTVCGAHHRALHRGELSIEGNSAENARFRHADGTPYGEAVQPKALEVDAKVFGALRGLGFRESDVRRVLGELRAERDTSGVSAELRLRAALRRLTRPCR